MKKIALAFILTIASCTAQKVNTIDAVSYASSDDLYFQNWVGGAPGSGSGTTVYFPAALITGETLLGMYHGTSYTNAYNYTADDRRQLVVRFYNGANQPDDVIMDLDSDKEYQNLAPDVTKLPVALKPNQLLFAFKGDKKVKVKYLLIDNIQERSMQAMPSMPQ